MTLQQCHRTSRHNQLPRRTSGANNGKGCEHDLRGVLTKAKDVRAQYVADLYCKSINAKASKIKQLTREEEAATK